MRSITQHYEGKNIYTRPLQGKPYYRNSGIIYAVDRIGYLEEFMADAVII